MYQAKGEAFTGERCNCIRQVFIKESHLLQLKYITLL
jgi:hypothetical protein